MQQYHKAAVDAVTCSATHDCWPFQDNHFLYVFTLQLKVASKTILIIASCPYRREKKPVHQKNIQFDIYCNSQMYSFSSRCMQKKLKNHFIRLMWNQHKTSNLTTNYSTFTLLLIKTYWCLLTLSTVTPRALWVNEWMNADSLPGIGLRPANLT